MRHIYLASVVAALVGLGPAYVLAGDIVCPKGTLPNGEETPDVKEAWCETPWHGKTVQHGPYRSWWPNGKLGTKGQYVYGKADGKWQGWYSNGELQGEEWFDLGRKVKARYFDKQGHPAHEPET